MKVGDYVRYKRPFDRKETIMIGKILRIYEPNKQSEIKGYDLDTSDVISDEFSIKSSPNIIDLIEVGDYVNGCKIIELATNIEGKVLYLETDIAEFDNVYACGNINIYEKDIRTIVTKEQFSQMEYRIGDD